MQRELASDTAEDPSIRRAPSDANPTNATTVDIGTGVGLSSVVPVVAPPPASGFTQILCVSLLISTILLSHTRASPTGGFMTPSQPQPSQSPPMPATKKPLPKVCVFRSPLVLFDFFHRTAVLDERRVFARASHSGFYD